MQDICNSFPRSKKSARLIQHVVNLCNHPALMKTDCRRWRHTHLASTGRSHSQRGWLSDKCFIITGCPSQGQNHKQCNSFAYKCTSVIRRTVWTALHNIFQSNMGCTSLLIKPLPWDKADTNQAKQIKAEHKCFRACHISCWFSE